MWLKDGRPDWLAKRPCGGLDRNGSWMELDDDRLQCFNIGAERKKERKGK